MAAPSAACPAGSRCTPSSGLTCATDPASKKPTPLMPAATRYRSARCCDCLPRCPEAPDLTEHGHLADRHRCHQQDAGRHPVRPAEGPLGHVHEGAGAARDIGCRLPVDGLHVVGAEHDDHEIDRLVREEAGREIGQPVAAWLDGRVPDGAAAVEALFDDLEARPQRATHDTGPADVTWQPPWRGPVGAGAVRVRIPKANDGPGHAACPPVKRSRRNISVS